MCEERGRMHKEEEKKEGGRKEKGKQRERKKEACYSVGKIKTMHIILREEEE